MRTIVALLLVCLTGCASESAEEIAKRDQRTRQWYDMKVAYYGELCKKQGFTGDALMGCILTRLGR